jgi:GMP synthase (glutamine-hydrolysing)
MRQCTVLRHVPFESLGLLEPLILARGFEIRTIDVPVAALSTTALQDAELVVVLGGPISVYEEHLYPFLIEELDVLDKRLQNDKPTIGICLGAQLMARALGAKVFPGAGKEIGWSPLQLTQDGKASALSAIDGQSVLHWHGDTYDLPQGATLLASTELTRNQAFAWHDAALALQFHLEVTAKELEAWYVGHTIELARWGAMSIPELRAAGQKFAPILELHAKRALGAMLDRVLGDSNCNSIARPSTCS